jgi:hypothetical protein
MQTAASSQIPAYIHVRVVTWPGYRGAWVVAELQATVLKRWQAAEPARRGNQETAPTSTPRRERTPRQATARIELAAAGIVEPRPVSSHPGLAGRGHTSRSVRTPSGQSRPQRGKLRTAARPGRPRNRDFKQRKSMWHQSKKAAYSGSASPALMPATNADHSVWVSDNSRLVLESRNLTHASSTLHHRQSPFPLKVLFRHNTE